MLLLLVRGLQNVWSLCTGCSSLSDTFPTLTDVQLALFAEYLGLISDKKLTFSPHFDYVSDKVQKLASILYSLINRRFTFSLDQKVLLYKAIFQPTILYSSVVWRGCAGTHKRRLQILQKKCLQLILNVPRLYGTSETQERSVLIVN
jgi:hypothetical protein